jgi:tetratricopeptide (TPR) repeat protein
MLLGAGLAVVVAGLVGWLLRPDPDRVAAEQALQKRDYAGAYTHLHACLRRRPDDRELLLLTARTARRANLHEQAEKHLRACERRQGPAAAIALERALGRAQRGDVEVAAELQARADRGDPDALLIWEVLIQHYLDRYQLFKARDCLDRYLERRPDDVHALLGRGYIWDRLFFYAEAARDFRRAVEIEPDNDQARTRLAEVLLIIGPPDECAAHFERLRQRHPDSVIARLGLARALRKQGRSTEARQLLDDLLAEEPRCVGALTERGILALDEGDTERATDWLKQAVELAPADRVALYNLCRCLQRSGRDADARAHRGRLDRLDADLDQLGKLTKAVLKTPHDPAPRCKAGILFLRNGEEQEGVRWLHMALREDPTYRPAHQALADHYQRIGQTERAAHHRQMAALPRDGSQKRPTGEPSAPMD